MNRTDTLLRLKRFKVDEMKRRVASIEAMRADLDRMLEVLHGRAVAFPVLCADRVGDADATQVLIVRGGVLRRVEHQEVFLEPVFL